MCLSFFSSEFFFPFPFFLMGILFAVDLLVENSEMSNAI